MNEQYEDDESDLLDRLIAHRTQQVQSLPMEAQLYLQTRIDAARSIFAEAIAAYSMVRNIDKEVNKINDVYGRLYVHIILVTILASFAAVLLGGDVGLLAIIFFGAISFCVAKHFQRLDTVSTQDKATSSVLSVEMRWKGLGLSDSFLMRLNQKLLDHDLARIKEGVEYDYSLLWEDIKSKLTHQAEDAVSIPQR